MKRNPLKYSRWIIISFVLMLLSLIIFFVVMYSIEYVEADGIIKPIDYQLIAPKIAGIVKKIYFKDGDVVKNGDLLAELESKDFEFQITNSQNGKEKLESLIKYQEYNLYLLLEKQKLTIAKRDKEFSDNILKKQNGIITEKEYNEFIYQKNLTEISEKSEISSLNNEIKQNKLKLDSIIKNIEYNKDLIDNCKIYSQLDGVVIEEDNTLKESRYFTAGQQIFYVFSDTNVYAEVNIPEKKIPKIELNQKVKLFITALPWTRYKVFKGVLVSVKKTTPSVANTQTTVQNTKTNFYIGKIEITDPYFKIKSQENIRNKKLIFGMTLKAKISVGKSNLIKKLLELE